MTEQEEFEFCRKYLEKFDDIFKKQYQMIVGQEKLNEIISTGLLDIENKIRDLTDRVCDLEEDREIECE
jgi:hypothetical protein